MYKMVFESYMRQEPRDAKEKYIFIIDNKDLANAILVLQFKVVFLSYNEQNEFTNRI